MNEYEQKLVQDLSPTEPVVVIGVDEAGRGALAGPVVVAATWWDPRVHVRYPEERRGIVIRDSKKMTFLQRTRSFEALCQRGCNAIVFKSHEEIDQANVLRATLSAMHECVVACLSQIPQDVRVVILIDGDQMIAPTDDPRILHRTCVTKGDDLCYSIAAASILAKHARDMFMIEYPDELYGFSKNKGYGTRGHLQAIREHGPCAIHRMSFRPFSNPHDGFLEDD